MAILSLITMVGTIVLILATVRIAEPPDPSQIGGRSDFVVGPIHRNGALTQWIVAGGETLASIAIRPAPKTSPRDLRFGVRLLDDRGVELASSGASVAQTGPDGWLVIPLMPTPLTAGRRYGLQLSVPSREGTYLYVDATGIIYLPQVKVVSSMRWDIHRAVTRLGKCVGTTEESSQKSLMRRRVHS